MAGKALMLLVMYMPMSAFNQKTRSQLDKNIFVVTHSKTPPPFRSSGKDGGGMGTSIPIDTVVGNGFALLVFPVGLGDIRQVLRRGRRDLLAIGEDFFCG